jgi:hypothetical protein
MFKKKKRKKLASQDVKLAEELSSQKVKVYTNFNPYLSKGMENQVSIKTLEDIKVYHKKLDETRLLGECLKDKQVKKRHRRRVIKDVLKHWEREFKDESEEQKKLLLEKTGRLKKRRIRKIRKLPIYLTTLVAILGLLLSNQLKIMTKIPFFGKHVVKLYEILEVPRNQNILVGLTYLALFTALYILTIRTYFNQSRTVGANAEEFITKEFIKIHKRYKKQHKELKQHMFKYMKSRFYKQSYKIKRVYDPQNVLIKLEEFGNYINEKMALFSKYYFVLLLMNLILKMSVLSLTIYFGYLYVTF